MVGKLLCKTVPSLAQGAVEFNYKSRIRKPTQLPLEKPPREAFALALPPGFAGGIDAWVDQWDVPIVLQQRVRTGGESAPGSEAHSRHTTLAV